MKYLKKFNERLLHKEEYIKKLLTNNGYTPIKSLSGGSFGHTYELEGEKICKICYDRDEIETANILVGKKSKYLVNYYDVFKGIDFDIIIMEKLDMNLNVEKLNKAERLIGNVTGGYSKPNIGDILFEEIPNIINYALHIPFNSYLLDIVKMYTESSKYGKLILDTGHRNFGIKNNHLVAFDFIISKQKVDQSHIKKLIETEEELEKYRMTQDDIQQGNPFRGK
jgi:hypothetical protein